MAAEGTELTLDVEIIQPQQRDRVVDVEPEGEGAHEVGALLDGAGVGGDLGGAQLDALALHVHAALQPEVLHERRVDLGPGGLEGRHAVRRDGHLAVLDAHDLGGPGGGREARPALLVQVVDLHVPIARGVGRLVVGEEEGGGVCRGGVEEVFVVLWVGGEGDGGGRLILGSRLEGGGCWHLGWRLVISRPREVWWLMRGGGQIIASPG